MSLIENRQNALMIYVIIGEAVNAPMIFPQFAICVTIKNIAPWQKPAMSIGKCDVNSQRYFSPKQIATAIPTATSHL